TRQSICPDEPLNIGAASLENWIELGAIGDNTLASRKSIYCHTMIRLLNLTTHEFILGSESSKASTLDSESGRLMRPSGHRRVGRPGKPILVSQNRLDY